MPVYTVHEPRKLTGDPVRDAERFVFVRDGFYFWAFVLGPLWMLRQRMWLVLLSYIVFTAAVQACLWALGVAAPVKFTVGVLIALLIGFEAATLRRFSLRRWRNVGSVVGLDPDDAERRFFEAWMKRAAPPKATSAPSGGPTITPPVCKKSFRPDCFSRSAHNS